MIEDISKVKPTNGEIVDDDPLGFGSIPIPGVEHEVDRSIVEKDEKATKELIETLPVTKTGKSKIGSTRENHIEALKILRSVKETPDNERKYTLDDEKLDQWIKRVEDCLANYPEELPDPAAKESVKVRKPIFKNTNMNQELFSTYARVDLDDDELKELSDAAIENDKVLREKMIQLKDLKQDIKELKKQQDGFLIDLRELKHTVTVEAWWQYDWDGNEKILWGKHRGRDICLERIELSDLDRQLRLGDDRL